MGSKNIIAGCVGLALLSMPVNAQVPVAIVEEIVSTTAGVEFMDYLAPGRQIQLSSNDRLVIGYMRSCWRETIMGGTVTIGVEQSEVSSGVVERIKVPCDAGKKGLTSKETTGSGAMVFRKKPQLPPPGQTIYFLSPVFALKTAGNLAVERLDKREQPIDVNSSRSQIVGGHFVDFAKSNVALTAGGLYRAKAGGNEIVFKIDPSAGAASSNIIGRLVHLSPPD